MSKLKAFWEKYKKIEIIGSGAFGDVYRAKFNNQCFLVKAIKKSNQINTDN